MLGADCWKSDYDLSLKLYDEAAKSAYCISDFTSVDNCMKAILKNATSILHTVGIVSLKIKHFNDVRKFQDALDTAMSILEKIGEDTNYAQSEAMLITDVNRAKELVQEKSLDEISKMKEMNDEYKLATMAILSEILSSVYFINPQLYFRISLRMVFLTFEYGVCKFSALGFSALGSALCSKGSSMMDSFPYQVGKLSILFLENVYVKELAPWVYGCFYGLVHPFYASIHDSIDRYLDIFRVNLEIGCHIGTTVSASTYCAYAFLGGKNLEKLKCDIDEFDETLPIKTKPHLAIHQAIINLLGLGEKGNSLALLSGKVFQYQNLVDDRTVPVFDLARIFVTCCMVRSMKLVYFVSLDMS